MLLSIHQGKVLAFCMAAVLLCGCASYNQQASEFYQSLAQGDYAKASKKLDHNKLLRKNRNRLLYLLEKGRVEHLLQNFEKSNRYLNEADAMMESSQASAKDIIAGTLINPMMENYRGEDFEKYMVHYYKALNYLQLNQTGEALVEARRISLRTYAQEDVKKGSHYTQDAFSFILQGLIYEKAGEINNAFIAYRNAAELYLSNDDSYYGTAMPLQLKKDLLRMAYLNDFRDELERFENLFEMKFSNDMLDAGSLVLFWENGLAPVKTQQNLVFSFTNDGSGNYFFTENSGLYKIAFDHRQYNYSNDLLSGMHIFKVALPRYEKQLPVYNNATVRINGASYYLEQAQNISELALATLQERKIKELTKILTRQLVKKLAEEAAKPQEDETDQKKKNSMYALSLGIKMFGLASEKADTRNWQSLPHSIYYTRTPLQPGENTITIELKEGMGTPVTRQFKVKSQGSMQFENLTTL